MPHVVECFYFYYIRMVIVWYLLMWRLWGQGGFIGPLLPYFKDYNNPFQPSNIANQFRAEAARKGYPFEDEAALANKYLQQFFGTSVNTSAEAIRNRVSEFVSNQSRNDDGLGPYQNDALVPRSLRINAARAYGQLSKRFTQSKVFWQKLKPYVGAVRKHFQRVRALKTVVSKMKRNAVPWLVTGVTKGKWMYPGVNYIGPGNKLNEGKPVSYHDRLAYIHDHQYDYLQKKGVNPYFTFNEADREMLKHVDTTNDEGMAEWLGMNAKRIFKSNRVAVPKIRSWEEMYGKAPTRRGSQKKKFQRGK